MLKITERGGCGKQITSIVVTTRNSNTHDNKQKRTATYININQEERTSIYQQHTAAPVINPHKQLDKNNATIHSVEQERTSG
jgi:hypothetical protein